MNEQTNDEARELLPCPFCGKLVVVKTTLQLSGPTYGIVCEYCDTRPFTGWQKTQEKAATIWNTRAQPAKAETASWDDCVCGHANRRHDSEDTSCDCCPCGMFKVAPPNEAETASDRWVAAHKEMVRLYHVHANDCCSCTDVLETLFHFQEAK